MFFHGQRFDAGSAEVFPILGAIGHLRDPARQPILEILEAASLFVVLSEKSVVATVIALDGRRMRAAGFAHDRRDKEAGDQSAIWIRRNHAGLDNFFRHHNHLARGARSIHGYSQAAPNVRITLRVGALHVEDGDIRTQRAHGY